MSMTIARQYSLFGQSLKTVPIVIDVTHPMVRLREVLDWGALVDIAEEQRAKKIKTAAGAKPHLRANVGAVVVRAMKSCDLRGAEDLIRNYLPARYLCDLHESEWTPDFRTLCDFEMMLGEEGLNEINVHVLQKAKEHGFVDVRGLCSDTTAQEAKIPHPTEVGLINGFAKSVEKAMGVLGRKAGSMKRTILEKIITIKKLVRKYRLFSKTKEAKREVTKKLLKLSTDLSAKIGDVISGMGGKVLENLKGHQKTAHDRLQHLRDIFQKLSPQIAYYLRCGRVAKNKIISLFQTEVRAIVRGKAGKKVEFGIKWGINQVRGGYISLFRMEGGHSEMDYAVEGVRHHKKLFGEAPKEYGYDRGGWSGPHIGDIEKMGVKRVAIAPKGKAKWKVSNRCRERMVAERAQVEGKIGTTKHYGLNKPEAKTTEGMYRCARRAELRFNLTKFLKDMFPEERKIRMAGAPG
jgi:hypothetical protein